MRSSQLLAWLSLNAIASAQTAVPSNVTTFNATEFDGNHVKLALSTDGNDISWVYDIYPLTDDAYTRLPPETADPYYVNGSVVLATPGIAQTNTSLPPYSIAFTSCDDADYAGFTDMQQTVANLITHNIEGILFYSTIADYCNITNITAFGDYQFLYTMNGTNDTSHLFQRITTDMIVNNAKMLTTQTWDDIVVKRTGSFGGAGSTAIAMIVLYAITGIITALFLVIIVTGAVRAHRHPERYGPRNALGIPRQSRAKGIARAMLDTIPIVKFGEPRTAPKDVEGRSSAEGSSSHEMTQNPRDQTDSSNEAGATANGTTTPSTATAPGAIITNNITRDAADVPTPIPESAAPLRLDTTQAVAASTNSVAPIPHSATFDDSELQTCSICTDDFAVGQDIRLLPCNHAFHPACVDPWLLDVSGTCPLCRIDLNPAEDADGDGLAPPLDPEAAAADEGGSARRREGVGRRRTVMSMFSNRHRLAHAGQDERLAALRRWNETEAARRASSSGGNGSTAAGGQEPSSTVEAVPMTPTTDTRNHSRLGAFSRLVTRRGRRTTMYSTASTPGGANVPFSPQRQP